MVLRQELPQICWRRGRCLLSLHPLVFSSTLGRMPSFPSVASVIVALFATTLLFNTLPVQATPSALVHGGFMNLKHRHARLDAAIRDVDSQALAKRESGEFTWFQTGLCVGRSCRTSYSVAHLSLLGI
jgi:hypothetical protein